MEDRPFPIILFGAFAGAVLWLVYFEFGDTWFVSKSLQRKSNWTDNLFSSDCGLVSGACTAEVEVAVDGCGKTTLKNRIDEALAFPMRTAGCKDIEDQLSARCPSNCKVDSTTMMVIPGALEVSMNETPNETGECKGSGKRKISVSASCRK